MSSPILVGDHPTNLGSDDTQVHEGNPPNLLASIADFLNANRKEVCRYMLQKGGWEGWLQSSLADHITNTTDYSAAREENIFISPRQQVDLWCYHKSEYASYRGGPSYNEPRIGIELKCGGEPQDYWFNRSGACHLQNRFRRDINKILGGVRPEMLTAAGAMVYAVAIAQEEYETFGFDEVEALTDTEVQKWTSDVVGNFGGFYMLWWGKSFQR
jgi:hypothetical protein